MKALALAALILLMGCEAPKRSDRVVAEILTCTDGTGGWGGSAPACRVVLDNGERRTVGRPVAVGDTLACGPTYCWQR